MGYPVRMSGPAGSGKGVVARWVAASGEPETTLADQLHERSGHHHGVARPIQSQAER